jgi:hypothetical protein
MVKKKIKSTELKPYWYNPYISVFYELEFNKKMVVSGTRLKIKGSRGNFVFHKLVHHSKLDKTWIDCMDDHTGEYRSFYVDRIKSIIPPKRSRKDK